MAALAGQGLVGGGERQLSSRWRDIFLRRQLCRSRGGRRNRQVIHRRFPRLRRCWLSDSSPRAWRASSGAVDAGYWSRASAKNGCIDPHYGAMLSTRFCQSKPPTILDVPVDMQWAALDIPDPETPAGSRGVGEPPVGGGCASILNALSDALGDEIFRRAPVNADTILTSLEAGRPMQHPLMAHI